MGIAVLSEYFMIYVYMYIYVHVCMNIKFVRTRVIVCVRLCTYASVCIHVYRGTHVFHTQSLHARTHIQT